MRSASRTRIIDNPTPRSCSPSEESKVADGCRTSRNLDAVVGKGRQIFDGYRSQGSPMTPMTLMVPMAPRPYARLFNVLAKGQTGSVGCDDEESALRVLLPAPQISGVRSVSRQQRVAGLPGHRRAARYRSSQTHREVGVQLSLLPRLPTSPPTIIANSVIGLVVASIDWRLVILLPPKPPTPLNHSCCSWV